MINLSVLLPTKNKKIVQNRRYGTTILLISALFISSCATKGTVTLGDMKVYGANEIWVYEPIKE
tara:strand:+ start:286 stop:477 length:192 start_codon:yes stop_codon:yes gene_type:complete